MGMDSEIKILYGLSLETSGKLREPLEQELGRKGKSLQTVCRYRKEGVYQYAKDQEEGLLMILEENLQSGNPYEKEELMQLTDIGENRIIFLLDKTHYGDDYIKLLYACGIYDALFLDEADPRRFLILLKKKRTNAEARKYYGIETARDREKADNIANTEYLNSYLEFVETGMLAEDVDQKYRFAASRLNTKENWVLAASLPGAITRMLQGNELYQHYIGDGKKKRGLLGLGRKEKQDTKSVSHALSEEVRNTPPAIAEERELAVSIQNERGAQLTKADFDNQEEDMLQVMDRYRTYYIEETPDLPYKDDVNATDLMMAMGTYLKEIDI
ncbi:MAG: hypothetical protein J1E98_00645 [Lachnospiraceae bacterium]|nr:hypothetical protein [Lachnospiraceae bacterium]